MIFLKLFLVPTSIALVSWAGVLWGPRVSGLLSGLPVLAGPIMLLLTLEHGTLFAEAAACASLRAVSAVGIFIIVYARAAQRWSWPGALAVSLSAWLLAILLLTEVAQIAAISVAITLGTLGAGYFLLPEAGDGVHLRGMAVTEIARRMFAGAVLTLFVTTAAGVVGPVWSGSITLFPILGTTLAVGSHRYAGADYTVVLLRGMFLGLLSLSSFLFVFAVLIAKIGLSGTLLAGVTLAIIVQLLTAQVLARVRTQ